MSRRLSEMFRRSAVFGIAAAVAVLSCAPPTQRASRGSSSTRADGARRGRNVSDVYGAHSASSTRTKGQRPSHRSCPRAEEREGKVEYIASFFIVKPVDMAQASGIMWHDVPNRGGRITITADLRAQKDVG